MLYNLNVLLTGLVAGFMFSYSLVLGNFFSYLVKLEEYSIFEKFYQKFRTENRIPLYYDAVLIAQGVVAFISLFFHFNNHSILAQVMAILDFPILILFHKFTGFFPLEEKLVSGHVLTKKEAAHYLRYNLSLHIIYGAVYLLTTFLLLLK